MDILKNNDEFLESTHFMVPVLSKTCVCDSLHFFPPCSFWKANIR